MVYLAWAILSPVARVAVIVFDETFATATVAHPEIRVRLLHGLLCFTWLSLHMEAKERLLTVFAPFNVAHATV